MRYRVIIVWSGFDKDFFSIRNEIDQILETSFKLCTNNIEWVFRFLSSREREVILKWKFSFHNSKGYVINVNQAIHCNEIKTPAQSAGVCL